jgi:transcriptional regulator with XRE-family HTH domain
MHQHEQKGNLEETLNDYISSSDGPNRESLREWVQRYPHYAKELVEFTTSWFVLEGAAKSDKDSDEDDTLITRGMEVVHGILNKHPPTEQAPEEGPIVNLIQEGDRRGLTLAAFATQVGLSSQTLARLNRGLIRTASIPTELINRIAEALQRSPSNVSDFFKQGPRLAVGANYRAAKRPIVGTQQDFFDVVRNDTTMREEHKAFWVDIEANTERE